MLARGTVSEPAAGATLGGVERGIAGSPSFAAGAVPSGRSLAPRAEPPWSADRSGGREPPGPVDTRGAGAMLALMDTAGGVTVVVATSGTSSSHARSALPFSDMGGTEGLGGGCDCLSVIAIQYPPFGLVRKSQRPLRQFGTTPPAVDPTGSRLGQARSRAADPSMASGGKALPALHPARARHRRCPSTAPASSNARSSNGVLWEERESIEGLELNRWTRGTRPLGSSRSYTSPRPHR